MDPIIVEHFTCTHKRHSKEDGSWVDRKSQQIYISYSRGLVLISGSIWIHAISLSIIWFLQML